MPRLFMCTVAAVFWFVVAGAQQPAGPGGVIRPRTTDAPDETTKIVGCVQNETAPNRFRLVLTPESRRDAKAAKALKGIASVDLVARGETNLQPYANQKVELTGSLSSGDGRARFEVVDARPIGTCEAPARR